MDNFTAKNLASTVVKNCKVDTDVSVEDAVEEGEEEPLEGGQQTCCKGPECKVNYSSLKKKSNVQESIRLIKAQRINRFVTYRLAEL